MADLLETPQFSLPFRLDSSGDVACHEQDGPDDVMQGAVTVLRYRQGERSTAPDFGIPDPVLLENGISLDELAIAVRRYEPEVDIEMVREVIDEQGVDLIHINLEAFDG